jgi:hypothetical protein
MKKYSLHFLAILIAVAVGCTSPNHNRGPNVDSTAVQSNSTGSNANNTNSPVMTDSTGAAGVSSSGRGEGTSSTTASGNRDSLK